MNKTKILGLVFALLATFAITTAPAEARATTGCSSQVVDKAMPWGEDFSYPYTTLSKIPKVATIRIVATQYYRYCPNGDKADKVMPLGWTLCHLHVSENASWLFDGIKIEPFVVDDNKYMEIPETRIDDGDGGEQVCVNILAPEERWFLTQNSAATSVTAWIVFRLHPDMGVELHVNGSNVRYYHPLEDMNLTGWYTYG